MRIALLGGTGDIGEGLALRWAHDTDHEIVIGSRDPEKARNKAEAYEAEIDDRGVDTKITGFENGMAADRAEDGFHYHKPGAGSVTKIAVEAAPEGVPVVGAFHNLAAGRLTDLDAELGIDTLLISDDEAAKSTVSSLAEDIEGLRALDAGSVANAAEVESVTPLLINVAMNNSGLHDLGVRFD
mgnify:CR=1 FL=1